MSDALIQQEFYCNPNAASTGAIFNRQYNRLLAEPICAYQPNSRVIRIAWGVQDANISAIAYQDNHIIAVHTFAEWNLVDAIQSVVRRHPNAPLIHYSDIPDPSLFLDSDGFGFYSVALTTDEAVKNALAAYVLNGAVFTSAAKERLSDFAMSYAPYRTTNDSEEINVYPAIAKALAVLRMTQPVFTPKTVVRPLRYASDKGVI
jgi:hypothetical protein